MVAVDQVSGLAVTSRPTHRRSLARRHARFSARVLAGVISPCGALVKRNCTTTAALVAVKPLSENTVLTEEKDAEAPQDPHLPAAFREEREDLDCSHPSIGPYVDECMAELRRDLEWKIACVKTEAYANASWQNYCTDVVWDKIEEVEAIVDMEQSKLDVLERVENAHYVRHTDKLTELISECQMLQLMISSAEYTNPYATEDHNALFKELAENTKAYVDSKSCETDARVAVLSARMESISGPRVQLLQDDYEQLAREQTMLCEMQKLAEDKDVPDGSDGACNSTDLSDGPHDAANDLNHPKDLAAKMKQYVDDKCDEMSRWACSADARLTSSSQRIQDFFWTLFLLENRVNECESCCRGEVVDTSQTLAAENFWTACQTVDDKFLAIRSDTADLVSQVEKRLTTMRDDLVSRNEFTGWSNKYNEHINANLDSLALSLTGRCAGLEKKMTEMAKEKNTSKQRDGESSQRESYVMIVEHMSKELNKMNTLCDAKFAEVVARFSTIEDNILRQVDERIESLNNIDDEDEDSEPWT